jgi:2-(1,2-epoxy-1,2-dihydrophenyl)acetyl-CoA isomerase
MNPEVMAAELLYEQSSGIASITFNRPHAKNAISFVLWEKFSTALDEIEREAPPQAVILTGAGGFFCAGGDIKTPPTRGEGALSQSARLELGQRVMRRLRALPCLTIAAIEGGAIGLGWSLALCCDMIVAADNARFSAPFLRFGLVPDGGASWLLTQRLGRHRAASLFFTDEALTAEQARDMGLVSQLSIPGNATEVALSIAQQAGSGNRHAIELTKRLLHRAESGELDEIHALELAYCQITQTGDEVKRARSNFSTK